MKKHAKRVRAEGSAATVKQQSENAGQNDNQSETAATQARERRQRQMIIEKAREYTKEAVKELLVPPPSPFPAGSGFLPFGPLIPTSEVNSARRLVQQVYKTALTRGYEDYGDLSQLCSLLAFHPGLEPETKAFRLLISGCVALIGLVDAFENGAWPDRPLTNGEYHLAHKIVVADQTGQPVTMEKAIDLANKDWRILRDAPQSQDLAEALDGMGTARSIMFTLNRWVDSGSDANIILAYS